MASGLYITLVLLFTCFFAGLGQAQVSSPERVLELPPGPDNPRNSEGAFIELNTGKLLFVYTRFTGGYSDHAVAYLAGRLSTDGGQNWDDEDLTILPNEGEMNIMSPSLIRLSKDSIAMIYMRKDAMDDCRPRIRYSTDEARSWSEPGTIIPDIEKGYYVLNNSNAVQLPGGRIILPLALHNQPGWEKWTPYGQIVCYYSDNNGRSWQKSKTLMNTVEYRCNPVVVQEPCVVPLKNGKLMMLCRTDAGQQFTSCSSDSGATWSPLVPSGIYSPRSPAKVMRMPGHDTLLLVWNDHSDVPDSLLAKRTPFTIAYSDDEGQRWKNARVLADDPKGWYCYSAFHFAEEYMLIAHCAGDQTKRQGLATTHIIKVSYSFIFGQD